MSNSAGSDTDSLATLRALTGHEKGFFRWFNHKYKDVISETNQVKANKESTKEQVSEAAKKYYKAI